MPPPDPKKPHAGQRRTLDVPVVLAMLQPSFWNARKVINAYLMSALVALTACLFVFPGLRARHSSCRLAPERTRHREVQEARRTLARGPADAYGDLRGGALQSNRTSTRRLADGRANISSSRPRAIPSRQQSFSTPGSRSPSASARGTRSRACCRISACVICGRAAASSNSPRATCAASKVFLERVKRSYRPCRKQRSRGSS